MPSTALTRVLTRILAAAGACTGAVLVARPGLVVAAACPELPPSRVWLVRLLGSRLVLQHGLLLARPAPAALGVAAGADALHALSVLPFLGHPRYGRAARLSGGVAAGSAAAAAALRRGARTR